MWLIQIREVGRWFTVDKAGSSDDALSLASAYCENVANGVDDSVRVLTPEGFVFV